MRNICAYLLASMGNNTVNVENMKNILASVGVEADESQLKVVLEKFSGKQVDKLISQGNMLMSATGGGGGMGAARAGGAAPAAAAAAAPKEEKKEEKKEEEEEESDDDMGFGLFD